ncbi:MAG TPA: ASKHA domain-containing protein [Armatimonadota bacterium]|jgi:uncharacterized 2Fe-2S/4Fe-4S cluster protein (DUF4445 family)
MSDPKTYQVRLQPIGAILQVTENGGLRDLLFEQGVEFPCGGHGRCRGCKVRVVEGKASIGDAEREHLSEKELQDGWRLACQLRAEDNLVIELRQWDASILSDDASFTFTPGEGLGVAVDLGTTTLVAQLLDLSTGHVLAVRTALNPQALHGGDVMSRVQYAVAEGGQEELTSLIRNQIGKLILQLLRAAQVSALPLKHVVVVGNTVMHHLFCGIDLEPLSHYPFEAADDGLHTFTPEELGWTLPATVAVQFLPCLGGFVGSDILAGIMATGIHNSEDLVGLVDLGTNGEIVLGHRGRLLCASTAAGPAFEGARISSGMRASTGAIWRVARLDGHLKCEVLGNVPARGVCGSGLVDAAAAGLELGLIRPTGRLNTGDSMPLADSVGLLQSDIRELQLAKGAIAAGIRLLLSSWDAGSEGVKRLYLAGAFGNYVNRASARRIGLLSFEEQQIHPVGNTALLGAKMALFAPEGGDATYAGIRAQTEHVSLHAHPQFQDAYVEEMSFPQGE